MNTWSQISQVSEMGMILLVPLLLRTYGIKFMMLLSMLAWVLRFGLLSFANPGTEVWMLICSCIVYGMAFDFFNISGSLYTEMNTPLAIRSSAQGIFLLMTNGLGSLLGIKQNIIKF